MGRQAETAAKIRSKKGHYALAAKENRPTLHGETEEYFSRLDEGRVPRLPEDIWEGGLEKGRGRLERRRARAACDVGFLGGRKKRKGPKTIIECRGERTELAGGKTTSNTRHYVSNRDCPAEEFARIIRGHWSIENNLHWALDVSFGEDGCRARKDNSPKNLAALRKISPGLLRAADAGMSVRRKMRLACINPDFLGKIIFNR